jgi:hypothetical protein
MESSAQNTLIKASCPEEQCCAWTGWHGRCPTARFGSEKTCVIHRGYYNNWWAENPPIANRDWMRAQTDLRDSLEQHMFQLREGHVGLDAVTQDAIASYVLAGERGVRDYTYYYKRLLCLSTFNPLLCGRLVEAYFGTMLEDFLYYNFLTRSFSDRIVYAETLFKEFIACSWIEPAWLFKQTAVVLALLRKNPRAEEYYSGGSWKDISRRLWWTLLRCRRLSDVAWCGRTSRDLLCWIRGGAWMEISLCERNPVSSEEREDVARLLEMEMFGMWRSAAAERSAVFKEELFAFTSHPAWYFTRCVDIEELRDFDESPEEIWANGVKAAGPFYLRAWCGGKN